MLASAGAKFAVPMGGNLHPDHGSPQVSHVAKKRDRTFPVAIFQFTVSRTHSAQLTECGTRRIW